MLTVVLKPLHRDREYIGIYFERNKEVELAIKKIVGIKWSKTNKCWYLPMTHSNYVSLQHSLNGRAIVKYDELKFFVEKSEVLKFNTVSSTGFVITDTLIQKKISNGNLIQLQLFIQELTLKAYSVSTIKTYQNEFIQLLQVLKNKPVENLTVDELRRYMVYAMEKKGISENTAHSRLNALKFYFEQVLKRQKFFWEIPRPKKAHQLPKVFSQEEITSILKSVGNLKHKAMLMLAYGAGLRVSEVVSLKTIHIDSSRMTIFINGAKGKKDRIASLSPVLLVVLREYARRFKPDKKGWLFEGEIKGRPYSTRSLQEVLQTAKNKAGIMRPGSVHSLRHSFATHLVERGTDVTMIQKLLGHNDIKTTLIYLHTSNKDLLKIISPLDDLKL